MEEARGATVRPVVRGSAGIHARRARSSHVRTRRPTLRARLLRRPIRSDRGLHDEPRGDPGQREIRGRGSGPVIDAHRPRPAVPRGAARNRRRSRRRYDPRGEGREGPRSHPRRDRLRRYAIERRHDCVWDRGQAGDDEGEGRPETEATRRDSGPAGAVRLHAERVRGGRSQDCREQPREGGCRGTDPRDERQSGRGHRRGGQRIPAPHRDAGRGHPLEGLAYECKQASIPIKFARLGPVSRRDVTDAATAKNPLNRAILAFNLEILPDAKTALRDHPDLKLLENDVIYRLIEDYEAWRDERKRQLAEAGRKEIAYPAKLLFLGEHVFRASKPAIFGVRVLAGRIRPGESVMRADGRPLGRIKAIRSGEKSLDGATQGQEVAISVDGITIGRQISGGDILYVDLPEADARAVRGRADLTHDEVEALEQTAAIKRKEDPFWGM